MIHHEHRAVEPGAFISPETLTMQAAAAQTAKPAVTAQPAIKPTAQAAAAQTPALHRGRTP